MRPHEKVTRELARFERVEWIYDGLNGKIIPWTKQNGGTSDDPSCQAFVVGGNGAVVARAPDAAVHAAAPFAEWLREQALRYEKEHPRTRVPFVPAEVEEGGGEEGAPPRCAALEEAREAGRALLLYVGREPLAGDAKAARAETAAARKFEKGTLGSKPAAEAAAAFVLLRFDLSEKSHAALARAWAVERAPALLLWLPGEAAPRDLGTRLDGGALAYQLKKHASAPTPAPGENG